MACFYPEDCAKFAVCPIIVALCPTTCCEDPPMCYPCLPRCPFIYCCERNPQVSRPLTCQEKDCCEPAATKMYGDGRKLPVFVFKRNGMQDQEHSKRLSTEKFLFKSPRDVVIECELCTDPVKVGVPAKVPCTPKPTLGCCSLKKKPIKVSLEDIVDD